MKRRGEASGESNISSLLLTIMPRQVLTLQTTNENGIRTAIGKEPGDEETAL